MVAAMSYWDDFYGHPVLPTGYNSTENDGDEIDGAGVNDSIIPVWTDMFVPLTVLVITDDMMAVFDGCADYVVPCQNNVITFRREVRTQVMRQTG